MCGVVGICGTNWRFEDLTAMLREQAHRGPDGNGSTVDAPARTGLAHSRLSIIDLSNAGRQPMTSNDGALTLIFNGEIYNYLELKQELADYPFRSHTDSEVILAAYARWGPACLDRLLGMFAFALWDAREGHLFAARDRFGVKPLHYHLRGDGTLFFASEVRALRAIGIGQEPDPVAWSTYLSFGLSDHGNRTFWQGIQALPPGHSLRWKDGHLAVTCWLDLADRVGPAVDTTPANQVQDQYLGLLEESVRLRFRADVPVGINLSGGLDSSALLALVHRVQGPESDVTAFTFTTGDAGYDELPWVKQMLDRTRHLSIVCELSSHEVPALAEGLQSHLQQPFGGLPTLAYARLFERARAEGILVLLDGQGMDEQWAGYDYYEAAAPGMRFVQGTSGSAVRPECLTPEFRALAERFEAPAPFADAVTNLQYRDTRFTKIPRALRFNDGVSMASSTELREPFMDHRLFELALRQPLERKIHAGRRKVLLRDVMAQLVGGPIVQAPKRPLQTPQREWLHGCLRKWADGCIESAIEKYGGSWIRPDAVRNVWQTYCSQGGDNSFFVWQWVTLGMLARSSADELSRVRSANS